MHRRHRDRVAGIGLPGPGCRDRGSETDRDGGGRDVAGNRARGRCTDPDLGSAGRGRVGRAGPAAARRRPAVGAPPRGCDARRAPRVRSDRRIGDRDAGRGQPLGGRRRHRLRDGRRPDQPHGVRPARRPRRAAQRRRAGDPGRFRHARRGVPGGRPVALVGRVRAAQPGRARPAVACPASAGDTRRREPLPRAVPGRRPGHRPGRRARGAPGMDHAALRVPEHRQGVGRAPHRRGQAAAAERRPA